MLFLVNNPVRGLQKSALSHKVDMAQSTWESQQRVLWGLQWGCRKGVVVSQCLFFSSLSVCVKLIGNGIITQSALETYFFYKWRCWTCREVYGCLVLLSAIHSMVLALSLATDSHHVNQNARKGYLSFFSSLSQNPSLKIIALESMMCDTFYQVTHYKIVWDSDPLCPRWIMFLESLSTGWWKSLQDSSPIHSSDWLCSTQNVYLSDLVALSIARMLSWSFLNNSCSSGLKCLYLSLIWQT